MMETIKYQGVEFPISDFGVSAEQEALAELAVCAKREKKLFHQLQHASGFFTRKIKANAYLASGACRLVAMVEQAKDLAPSDRLPLSVYKTLAGSFSLFHPILEPVSYWDKSKSSGKGYRRIHEFGPMNRAAQHMVMRVISAFFKPRPYQYNVSGKGSLKAMLAIKGLIGAGYEHVLRLDVRDFFGSFLRDGLYELLPIPKSVIDNAAMPGNLQPKPKKGGKKAGKNKPAVNEEDISLVHKEITSSCASLPVLPQGSLHAPILAEHAVSLMDITMPEGVKIVIYVDDILILSKSADGLMQAKHALLLAYEDSPAGDFIFEVSEETLPLGVCFLGYHIQQLPSGKLIVRPSAENEAAFKKDCKALKSAITKQSKKGSAAVAQAIANLYAYIRAWTEAFRAADYYQPMVEHSRKQLVLYCLKHDVSVELVKTLAGAAFHHQVKKIKVKDSYHWLVKIATSHAAFAV
jgi:hypothetical protein